MSDWLVRLFINLSNSMTSFAHLKPPAASLKQWFPHSARRLLRNWLSRFVIPGALFTRADITAQELAHHKIVYAQDCIRLKQILSEKYVKLG